MKYYLLLVPLLFTACQMPLGVPATEIVVYPSGVYKIRAPKDALIKGFSAQRVGTNVIVQFQEYRASNSAATIEAAANRDAMLIQATGAAVAQGAGAIVGQAVKGAVKP